MGRQRQCPATKQRSKAAKQKPKAAGARPSDRSSVQRRQATPPQTYKGKGGHDIWLIVSGSVYQADKVEEGASGLAMVSRVPHQSLKGFQEERPGGEKDEEGNDPKGSTVPSIPGRYKGSLHRVERP